MHPAAAVRKARRFVAWATALGHVLIGDALVMVEATLAGSTLPPTKLGMALYIAYLGLGLGLGLDLCHYDSK